MAVKSFVCLSDIHYPYQDKQALVLVERFLADFQPDILVYNGDILDFPTISKYAPRRMELLKEWPLQDQLDTCSDELEKFRDYAPEVWYVEGNHEDRLQLYLGSRAKELASLRALDFENLVGLPGLHIGHVPYGRGVHLNDRLFVYHGQYTGANWTDKERQSAGGSTITGHMHQQRVTYHRDRSRAYKNVGQGCLCDMNPPYLRTPPNWQQGFVYGHILDQDKFRVVEVEIVRGEEELWMFPDGAKYSVPLLGSRARARKSGRQPQSPTKKTGTVPAAAEVPTSIGVGSSRARPKAA